MLFPIITSKLLNLSIGGLLLIGAGYKFSLFGPGKKTKTTATTYYPFIPLPIDRGATDFGRFFNLSLEMLCIADFRGYFLHLNPAFSQILGYGTDEFLSQPFIEFVHPEDRESTIEQFEKLKAGQKIPYHENRYRCQDGSYRWLAWTFAPYEEEELIYATARDISEQKQAELALRYDEATEQAILEAIPDVIFSCLADGTFVDFKAASEVKLLVPPEQFLGKSIEDVLPQPMASTVMTKIHQLIATQKNQLLEYQLTIESECRDYEARFVLGGEGKILIIVRDIQDCKYVEKAVRESEERLSQIIQTISDGILVVDESGQVKFVNPAAEALFGRPKAELLTHQLGIPFVKDRIAGIEIRHPSGELTIVEMRTSKINWEQQSAYLISLRDITARYKAEQALQASEERYRQIVETAAEGIWVIDENNQTLFVNQQMSEMLGYRADEMLGRSLFDFMEPDNQTLAQTNVQRRQQGIKERHDFKFRRQDGRVLWAIVSASPLFDAEGNYIGGLGMITDITERKQAEAQLAYNASHDPLTHLPNRALFLDRLTQVLKHSQRCPQLLFAVLFIDLDEFKIVNDSLGHLTGDELLKMLAQRLQTCLKPNDTLARLGGDEFTILLEIQTSQEAIKVAENIHQQLASPFNLHGQEVIINASIGIAFSTTGYQHPQELLRDADTAMYRAKAQGKGCYAIFDRPMHQQVVERLQLEIELRRAIEKREFHLHYQPIISFKTGHITGFEAFIRWQHPEKGLISPLQFIPVAEETGLIVPIGYWVLKEACYQLKQWQEQFPKHPPLQISVNFSSKQLRDIHLLEKIAEILAQTYLDPQSLKLEITESLLIENIEVATEILLKLRERQIQLCLDDFGTGYSSLSYLHRLPFHAVKIDRAFVREMQLNNDNSAIVRAIVTLSHTLGMEVVAEGVETKMQIAQLMGLSCEYGQGYVFSKPLPSSKIPSLLQQPLNFIYDS